MIDYLQNEVKVQIEKNKHDAIKFLQDLVRAPSTSGKEKEAQLVIKSKLEELNCQIDMWEPDLGELKEHPYFVSDRQSFEGSPNVVGVIKGSGGGRSLILNGHIDVVPAGNKDWSQSPWSGHIEGDKVFGRGATDMKGGSVAMMMAVKCLQDLGIRLKGDLIIQSVIEEESGGAGTLACVLRGYKADAAIIPEPSALRIFPAQQGSMWFRIKVKGEAAHGATRYEGVSALEKSCIVVKAIEDLETARTNSLKNPLFKIGSIPLPINIGKISGGNWPSSVPEEVVLEGRMGVIPGEPIEEAKQQLTQAVFNAAQRDPWMAHNVPEVNWFGAQWVSGEVPENHELVKILKTNYKQCTSEEAKVEMSPWATDGGYLTNFANTPAIIFGPGPTEKAHFANEYVSINQLQTATEVITKTIASWCGIAD